MNKSERIKKFILAVKSGGVIKFVGEENFYGVDPAYARDFSRKVIVTKLKSGKYKIKNECPL